MLKKLMTITAATVLSVTVSANVQAATITVKKGDTLWDLSRTNNTSVENTKMLNGLTTDLIHPGDELTIAPEKHYLVEEGNTLWDIAKNNDTTVSQIKEWNNLHTDLIHPGLNLLIFEGVKNTVQSEVTNTATQTETTSDEPSETVSPKTAAAPTKEVAAPKESISTPKEEVAAPKESVSKPKEEVATPKESVSKPKVNVPAPKKEVSKPKATSKKVVTVEATAYTASCKGCSGITATGINLKKNPNMKVISVDPNLIPLGSKVYVEGYGEAIAGDTGGAIKGHRIDVFVANKQDAINFGRKQVKVTILN
ncbi:LysM peptidoglycan-binding domain-containing protein [Bacillus sp. AFS017336]|uniref:LysM peptidoglycan-binding domain-containing protein n=1 Tax=Bacillus sp. AFS017336 TaxID=2033489 RepID=UPI000BEF4AF8|nr:LysM peptidoglycan-binding domain-containing protein [Bacillus sp. AFS017336]PEK99733.1 peptidoglycan-binding protein [Bacillus sp. AFS017336]